MVNLDFFVNRAYIINWVILRETNAPHGAPRSGGGPKNFRR